MRGTVGARGLSSPPGCGEVPSFRRLESERGRTRNVATSVGCPPVGRRCRRDERAVEASAVGKNAAAAAAATATADEVRVRREFPEPLAVRPKSPKYKTLLAIDGGGMRGVVPAIVLQEVERAISEYVSKVAGEKTEDVAVDLADYFDCIAGTSVGSILAAYFATKGEFAKDFILRDEFQEKYGSMRPGSAAAAKIPLIERGVTIFPGLLPSVDLREVLSLKQLLFPKYGKIGLMNVLKDLFGDAKLSDCQTSVVIPAFELKSSRPCSFWANKSSFHDSSFQPLLRTGFTSVKVRNKYIENGEWWAGHRRIFDPEMKFVEGYDFSLRDVVQASASAPTFFPAATVAHADGDRKLYVDGGLFANNPTAEGMVFLMQHLHVQPENVAVLSVGTGSSVPDLKDKASKGFLGWAGDLFSVVMDRKSDYLQQVVDGVFYGLLDYQQGQYTRIHMVVDEGYHLADALREMDNPRKASRLEEIGKVLVEDAKDDIQAFVEKYIFAEGDSMNGSQRRG